MRSFLIICLIHFSFNCLFGQNQKEEAINLAAQAIKLMDNGQIVESIDLLKEAKSLDPSNIDIIYEIAYAHYLLEEYEKSIEILSQLVKEKAASDRFYQLLGNSFDYTGNREKAISTYEDGLKKIPRSGRLHLELGIMYQTVEDYDKAINYYEKGTLAEPMYSSNYYRLAQIFLDTDQEVWGMIYGEIFMNLERNSERTSEMSKRLYDTYKSEIQFTSDTTFSVSFCNAFIDASGNKKPTLSFGVTVYEPTMIFSIINEKLIDINSLSRIRTRFVEMYYDMHHDKKYPNILFDYQRKIMESGHIDAYNHWILMQGENDGFNEWYGQNGKQWDQFVEWFNPNSLIIPDKDVFVRYDMKK
jgi:tetratricopeptide (TPR) repeat protein